MMLIVFLMLVINFQNSILDIEINNKVANKNNDKGQHKKQRDADCQKIKPIIHLYRPSNIQQLNRFLILAACVFQLHQDQQSASHYVHQFGSASI